MKIMKMLLLLAFVHGCGDKQEKKSNSEEVANLPSNVSVIAEWDKPPVANSANNTVLLTFTPKGQTIEVTDIDPQMPTHGHGTVKNHQRITPLNDTDMRTRVSGVYFIMPGPWVIDVFVKVDGVLNKTSFATEVN